MIKRQMYSALSAVCIGILFFIQLNVPCFALGNAKEAASYSICSQLTKEEKEIIEILSKIENDTYTENDLEALSQKVKSIDFKNSNNIKISSYILKTLSSKSIDNSKVKDMQDILIDYLIKNQNYDGSWKTYSFGNQKGNDETKLALSSLVNYIDSNKNEEGIIITDKAEKLKNALDTSLKYLALENLSNMASQDSHDLSLRESPTVQSSPYYTGSIDNNSTVINMGSAFNNKEGTVPTNINNAVTIDNSVTTNYITKTDDEIDDSDLTSIRKNIKQIKSSLDDIEGTAENINNYNTTNNTEGDTYNTTTNTENIEGENNLSDELKNFLSQLLGGQKEKYSNTNEDGSPDYSSDVENILDLDGEKDEEGNVDLSELATKEDLNKLAKYIHDTNMQNQKASENNKVPKEIVISIGILCAGFILKKLSLRLGGK